MPANTAEWVVAELIEHGRVRRSYLGLGAPEVPISRAFQRRFGFEPPPAVQGVGAENEVRENLRREWAVLRVFPRRHALLEGPQQSESIVNRLWSYQFLLVLHVRLRVILYSGVLSTNTVLSTVPLLSDFSF